MLETALFLKFKYDAESRILLDISAKHVSAYETFTHLEMPRGKRYLYVRYNVIPADISYSDQNAPDEYNTIIYHPDFNEL